MKRGIVRFVSYKLDSDGQPYHWHHVYETYERAVAVAARLQVEMARFCRVYADEADR